MNHDTASCSSAKETTITSGRESNFELFRIITMMLIIAHHYVVNSGLIVAGGVISSNPSEWRSLFLLLFGAWGKTGINCFVLITGYFMCTSRITLKKYSKLLLEVYFYKLVGFFVFLIAGYESVSLVKLVKLILPVSSVTTDFVGCYLIFFLCIPFLNILVHHMTKRQHICLLGLLVIIYVLIGSIPVFSVSFNYVTWFSVLYVLASFVRLYPCKCFQSQMLWRWSCLASLLLASASVIVCMIVPPMVGIKSVPYFFVADSNKILALAVGFSGFSFFKNLRIKPSRFINTVASTSLGVLLIHANSDAMRTWLWKDTLNNVGMYNSPYLIVHAFASVVVIFAVSASIDYLRIRFVEKPFFNACWDKIEIKLRTVGHSVMKRMVPDKAKK